MDSIIKQIVNLVFIEKDTLWEPPCDAYSHDDLFVIEIEITNLDTKRLSINITDKKTITIIGAKHRDTSISSNYLRAERVFGSFKKQVELPCPVRFKSMKYTDGILKITLIKE
ncbi:Hsp20/alpha crystallin family protein [Hippea sp. KM1]|uniref:Hsp20/alpha crystallin family protein n=1 Tax=Hippea sp. KM1 TaxID=944481 RepID=UPI00046CA660|nr:Hsp20 family protein [Hippea sp. KM1]